jgi:hypothetical protein
MDRRIIITANGSGERMKCISPLPKFSLFYKGKRILEHLIDTFPDAKVLSHYDIPYIDQGKIIKCKPTNSRRETLEYIKDMENVLIVDCDIYVDKAEFDLYSQLVTFDKDFAFWKHSDETETEMIPAGVYFLKKVTGQEVEKLELKHLLRTTHLGTPNEYTHAVLGE